MVRLRPLCLQPEITREDSGSANGLTFDLDGPLVMCEGNARQMTRMEPNGTITGIADRWDNKSHLGFQEHIKAVVTSVSSGSWISSPTAWPRATTSSLV